MACDVFKGKKSTDYTLTDLESGELLVYNPRFPSELYMLSGTWLEPGDRLRLTCDLTEVYALDQPGRFRLDVEIFGLYFAVPTAEGRELGNTIVRRTPPWSGSSEFEVRSLTDEELVPWRRRAAVGDVRAVRVLGANKDVRGFAELENASRSKDARVRSTAVEALARLPTAAATAALGRAMHRERDAWLKRKIAELMVEDRKDFGAELWIRRLAWDRVVFIDYRRDGQLYRYYPLRKLSQDFFSGRSEPLAEVKLEEPIRSSTWGPPLSAREGEW